MSRWQKYELIALDEVGYVPLADIGAEFLFQVISDRAERAALIVTTNLPFSEWTTVFPNPRLCKALLDRITDRAHIIETARSLSASGARWKRGRNVERERRRVRAVWPPRRPFRLNGAALTASPGSTPAGAAKPTPRNEAEYQYPGGPNLAIKVGHAGVANSSGLTIDLIATMP